MENQESKLSLLEDLGRSCTDTVTGASGKIVEITFPLFGDPRLLFQPKLTSKSRTGDMNWAAPFVVHPDQLSYPSSKARVLTPEPQSINLILGIATITEHPGGKQIKLSIPDGLAMGISAAELILDLDKGVNLPFKTEPGYAFKLVLEPLSTDKKGAFLEDDEDDEDEEDY